MQKPRLPFWQIWNLSFGFFGVQITYALIRCAWAAMLVVAGVSLVLGAVAVLVVKETSGKLSKKQRFSEKNKLLKIKQIKR